MKSLWRLSHADTGLRAEHLVTGTVTPVVSYCAKGDQCVGFFNDVRERAAALIGALERRLPDWDCVPPEGGLFLWAQLPAAISTSLCVLARERGLAITPGPRFGSAGLLERRLRLPYSLAPAQLERAVAILADVAAEAGPADAAPAFEREYAA